jgi:hypothetical protein
MSALQWLLDAIQRDPVFAYALLAAALLGLVSLMTGLLRRDVAVLARPRILLRIVGAVLAAFALAYLSALLVQTFGPSAWTRLVGGLERVPLALVTLAYGPGIGVVVAVLVAGLQANGWLPGWQQAVFALELAVLGWLAIYPSPRSSRWAGPFDALLAYALAWGTGGLALLEARTGAVTPATLWAQQRPAILGVALSAALLVLVPPAAYRRAFPHSRIAPPDAEPDVAGETSIFSPHLGDAAPRDRDPMKLTVPDLPRAMVRGRRRRELEPLPDYLDEDGPDAA